LKIFYYFYLKELLDLLYRSLKKYEAVYNLYGATDDWLDTQDQKELVLSKARLFITEFEGKSRLALLDWIERESGPDWKAGRIGV